MFKEETAVTPEELHQLVLLRNSKEQQLNRANIGIDKRLEELNENLATQRKELRDKHASRVRHLEEQAHHLKTSPNRAVSPQALAHAAEELRHASNEVEAKYRQDRDALFKEHLDLLALEVECTELRTRCTVEATALETAQINATSDHRFRAWSHVDPRKISGGST